MDIETLSNMFCYSDYNIETKEINQFVLYDDKQQLLNFIRYLYQIKVQIGFNNLSFDAQVIEFILKNEENWSSPFYTIEKIVEEIYEYSQYCIQLGNEQQFPPYPEWKLSIPQIDLFKIHHFNNKARSSSLKWIEFSIDFPNLEESPISHSKKIEKSDIQSILDYNLNDVMATYELYKITIGDTEHPLYKGVDKLQLRRDIQKEFGLRCTNYNDVRIGDELNKLGYCKEKKIEKKEIPSPNKEIKQLTFGECYPEYMKFETQEFKNFTNALAKVIIEIKEKTPKF